LEDREATDYEAKVTVKAGTPHYGYKMHVAVDAEYGVIRDLAFASEDVHDSRLTEQLVPDDQSLVLADKAYYNEDTEQGSGRLSLILYKAFRNRPLDSIKKEFNRMASSMRSRIVRTFGYLKHWAAYSRFGIQENESQALWYRISYTLLSKFQVFTNYSAVSYD
jgi:hypothetical protein